MTTTPKMRMSVLVMLLFPIAVLGDEVVLRRSSFVVVRPGGCKQPTHGHAICGRLLVVGQRGLSPRVRLETMVYKIDLTADNSVEEPKGAADFKAELVRPMHPGETFRVEVLDSSLRMIQVGCRSCDPLAVASEPGDIELNLYIEWKKPTSSVRIRDEIDE
jgi:hypothetical protein